MKYEWEKGAAKKLAKLPDVLDGDLMVIGYVVAHSESIEGAIIQSRNVAQFDELELADLLSDINGDADRQYREAVRDWRRTFPPAAH